jgi:hypothetical protein
VRILHGTPYNDNMKTLIVSQATSRQRPVSNKMIQSLEKHFLPGIEKEYCIFSDKNFLPDGRKTLVPNSMIDLNSSFYRYRMFLEIEEKINAGNYDMIFHVDSDMVAVRETKWEDIALEENQDAVLMQHPTMVSCADLWLPPQSSWKVGYYQACFFGCRPKAFIEMSRAINEVMEKEENMSFVLRRVADEGYFNSYWVQRIERVKKISCAFGFPTSTKDWMRWSGWAAEKLPYKEVQEKDIRFIHHNMGDGKLPLPYNITTKYPWTMKKPEWGMDERHIYWMADVLSTGHHRSALEIGPLHGATSTAFIEAINAGKLDSVTFVDMVITPELEKLVSTCRHPERVEMLQGDSIAVMSSGRKWDFVLVDGDHSLTQVAPEVDQLLLMRPLTVMAHDTGLEDTTGPSYLKHTFQVLPEYYCLEENMRREKERTYRGLFLATQSLDGLKEFKESLSYWSNV